VILLEVREDMESSWHSLSSRSPSTKKQCLRPMQKQGASVRHSSDRFILERGSMDLDVARFMITRKEKKNNGSPTPTPSPAKKAYKMELAYKTQIPPE
jgi:hypothetical protein